MITEKKAKEIAERYAKLDSDKLFQLFYDALPKTSRAFQLLAADVTAMASFIAQKKEKQR